MYIYIYICIHGWVSQCIIIDHGFVLDWFVHCPYGIKSWPWRAEASPQSPQTPVIRTTTPKHPRLRTWR